ncbi:MAG: hypothetical protein KBT04_01535 [Bacteroidales bacterium]|nr:hypothetical protein [Candidatus Colimorpha onthohippi]
MNKLLLLLGVCLLLCTACTKEKTCRCSVPNSQTTHVFTIKKGDCTSINTFEYDDETAAHRTDSVFCVEY